MSANNNFVIIGNVGNDPVSRPAGDSLVVAFNVAVVRPGKDKRTGEYVTDWFACEAWGGLAEYIATNIGKGHKVSVSGWVKIDKWEKDGVKHSKPIVCVDSLFPVASRGE